MISARELLIELDPGLAPLVDDLRPQDDLQEAGIDSADLIRLSLLIEERLSIELDTGDLDRLMTIAGIEETLAEGMARSPSKEET